MPGRLDLGRPNGWRRRHNGRGRHPRAEARAAQRATLAACSVALDAAQARAAQHPGPKFQGRQTWTDRRRSNFQPLWTRPSPPRIGTASGLEARRPTRLEPRFRKPRRVVNSGAPRLRPACEPRPTTCAKAFVSVRSPPAGLRDSRQKSARRVFRTRSPRRREPEFGTFRMPKRCIAWTLVGELRGAAFCATRQAFDAALRRPLAAPAQHVRVDIGDGHRAPSRANRKAMSPCSPPCRGSPRPAGQHPRRKCPPQPMLPRTSMSSDRSASDRREDAPHKRRLLAARPPPGRKKPCPCRRPSRGSRMCILHLPVCQRRRHPCESEGPTFSPLSLCERLPCRQSKGWVKNGTATQHELPR